MDIWDKKKRSAVMARIRSKDTKPELIVRHYLYSHGYRYRKNVKTTTRLSSYMDVSGTDMTSTALYRIPIPNFGKKK